MFVAALTLIRCSAEPGPSDLERVRGEFLETRFQAVFDKRLRDMSDLELFREVCVRNRINPDRALEMLKKSDARFHSILIEDEPR